jgi:PGF-pre-PGF domain-containing protein
MSKTIKKQIVILFLLILFSFSVNADDSLKARKIRTTLEEGTNSFFVSNVDIAVTSIYFDSSKSFESVSMEVERPMQPSSKHIAPSGTAYQYINISKEGITDSDISNIRIKFRVEKSWINSNNIDESSINLYTYTDKWMDEETEFLTKEDNTYYYYESSVSKFGYFLISGKTKRSENIVVEQEENKPIVVDEPELTKNKDKRFVFYLLIGLFLIVGVLFIYRDKIFKQKKSMISDDSDELNEYIQEAKAQGVNYNEIKKSLIANGWNENIVETALNKTPLPDEITSKIKGYVSSKLRKGIPRMEIKRELMAAGWQEETVDQIFGSL